MSRQAILGVGTATFLTNYGLRAAAMPDNALLHAAVDAGIRYLDTAADYGDSETAVGRALSPDVRVCTKIAAAGSLADVQRSVERLGMAPDTILVHSAGRAQLASAAAIASLEEAKRRGLTSRAGASTYGAEDAAFALAQPWVDVVQVEYSVLNQSVLRSVSRAHARQEIVVRSVLCKGLLTSRRSAAPQLVEQVQSALDEIERCAREWGRSAEQLAIRFALDTPGVDVVLVGVATREELDTALEAEASPRLTADQWHRLATLDRSAADAAHPERWNTIA